MAPANVRRPGAANPPEGTCAALSPASVDIPDALEFSRFAETMSNFAATVCVAASADGDERYGRTVTAVTSLSHEPPSLLVSITRGSDLERLIARTGRFSLNLLAEGQEAVGNAFAGKIETADRFAIGNWERWPSGQPRLAGAATAIECRVAGSVELDTHCLFIGVLVGSESSGAKPLLWHRRGYRNLAG